MSGLNFPTYHHLSTLPRDERDALVISSRIVDGQTVVVSRYSEDIWFLHGQPTNRGRADTYINFLELPTCFRDIMRAVVFRYLRRGRKGGRTPSDRAVIKLVVDAKPFLKHIEVLGLRIFSEIGKDACLSYVEACRQHRVRGRPLKPATMSHRFAVVEALYELSHSIGEPFLEYPWPNDSFKRLAGGTGLGTGYRESSTPLIPDGVFSQVFQKAWEIVEQAPSLLNLRDAWLDELHKSGGESWNKDKRSNYLSKFLRRKNFPSDRDFTSSLLDIRVACYIVIASTSGCRNHELAFLQIGACYSTTSEDEFGVEETYHWMQSQSTKTGAGHTDWMIPEAATVAIKVMEQWAKPLQLQIDGEVEKRRAANPKDPQIEEALRHRNAVFLTSVPSKRGEVRTWTGAALNLALKTFVRKMSIKWKLSSHQFRRKFANYAARSQFGDLRYLKKHFKHWSIDMTLGYALNEAQEIALYAEIQDELDDLKVEVVGGWLQPNAQLSGGFGTNLMVWRGQHPVVMFKSHENMIRTLAQSTPIRSNLHSWCTADDDLCVGNDMERTRCTDCNNAVIERKHAPIYRGMCSHLQEVATKCGDIGRGGLQVIERDLNRCRKVLQDLGESVEAAND